MVGALVTNLAIDSISRANVVDRLLGAFNTFQSTSSLTGGPQPEATRDEEKDGDVREAGERG